MVDINIGRTEAESLQRQAYAVFDRSDLSGGRGIETFTTGNAFGDFEGPAGTYNITVGYLDESDGEGDFSILINNVVIATWLGDGGGNGFGTPETETVQVNLVPGDVIGIRSRNSQELGDNDEGSEFGRIDYLEVVPVNGSGGSGASIGVGLTEAEGLSILGGYAIEGNTAAGNGLVVGTTSTGAVEGSFSGAASTYSVTVNYLDESDGVGTYQLSVNGSQVGTWQGTGG